MAHCLINDHGGGMGWDGVGLVVTELGNDGEREGRGGGVEL